MGCYKKPADEPEEPPAAEPPQSPTTSLPPIYLNPTPEQEEEAEEGDVIVLDPIELNPPVEPEPMIYLNEPADEPNPMIYINPPAVEPEPMIYLNEPVEEESWFDRRREEIMQAVRQLLGIEDDFENDDDNYDSGDMIYLNPPNPAPSYDGVIYLNDPPPYAADDGIIYLN